MESTVTLENKEHTNKIETILVKVENDQEFLEETDTFEAYVKEVSNYRDYKCSICTNKYLFEEVLNMHMEIHSFLAPHTCTVCGESQAKNKKEFTIHMNKHIKERVDELRNTSFICKICNLQCRCRSKLALHVRIHTGENPYVCTVCNKGFKNNYALKYHVNTHVKTEDKELKNICQECNGNFATTSSLKRHIRKCHYLKKSIIIKKCQEVNCNKTFYCKQSLDRHRKIEHPEKLFVCEICNKTFVIRRSRENHIIRFHGGAFPTYKCDFCNECFADVYPARDHYLTAHFKAEPKEIEEWLGNKYYPCKLCQKPRVYRQLSRLKKHFKNMHLEKNIFCDKCNSGPYTYSELTKHHYQMHDDIVCEICTENFVGQNRLKLHVRLEHTKRMIEYNRFVALKKLNCTFCFQKFSATKPYKNHLQSKHNVSSEKLYLYIPVVFQKRINTVQCKICKKKFPNRSEFIKHMSSHQMKAYKCPLCDDRIYTKAGLLRHTRTDCKLKTLLANDSASDVLTCGVCAQTFNKLRLFRQHIVRAHRALRQDHKCGVCKTEFVSQTDYLKHILQEHFDTYACQKKDYHQCRICQKLFSDTELHIDHLLTEHSQVRITQCVNCHKVFFNRSDHLRHSRHAHKTLYYECRVCHKKYSERYKLNVHMIKNHPDISPYQCELCDEGFLRHRDYLTHKHRTHSRHAHKTVYHECRVCHNKYSVRYRLNLHMMKSHPETSPYPCDLCDEGFLLQRDYLTHKLKTHTFRCKVCRQSFKSLESLNDHNVKHSGGYQFKCKICNKGFNVNRQYWRHLNWAHTSEREGMAENDNSDVRFSVENHIIADNNLDVHDDVEVKVEKHSFSPTLDQDSVKSYRSDIELNCSDSTVIIKNEEEIIKSLIKVEPIPYVDTSKGFVEKYVSEVGIHTSELGLDDIGGINERMSNSNSIGNIEGCDYIDTPEMVFIKNEDNCDYVDD